MGDADKVVEEGFDGVCERGEGVIRYAGGEGVRRGVVDEQGIEEVAEGVGGGVAGDSADPVGLGIWWVSWGGMEGGRLWAWGNRGGCEGLFGCEREQAVEGSCLDT